MRLSTKVKVAIVAVPVVVVVAAGTMAIRRFKRRKKAGRGILSAETRTAVEELLRLKGEDFVPDGLGTSLYHRRLTSLSDKDLLALYALVKTVEAMRRRGVDLGALSKEQAGEAIATFREALATKQGRMELVAELGALGFDVLHGVMQDGLLALG